MITINKIRIWVACFLVGIVLNLMGYSIIVHDKFSLKNFAITGLFSAIIALTGCYFPEKDSE